MDFTSYFYNLKLTLKIIVMHRRIIEHTYVDIVMQVAIKYTLSHFQGSYYFFTF